MSGPGKEHPAIEPGRELPLAGGTVTVGGLVAERPRAAAVLERLGLDYCCGGGRALEDACRDRGLDPRIVLALVDAHEGEAPDPGRDAHDVGGAAIPELCEHIVADHHEPLRRDLARISELLDKVVRAHAAQDPAVERLRDLFTETRSELEAHMDVEEEELFPACRALADGPGSAPFADRLLGLLEDTHASTGEALRGLRELGGDYRPAAAHCTTHRVLLHALGELEHELHRHIHEENNVLFVKVREQLSAPA